MVMLRGGVTRPKPLVDVRYSNRLAWAFKLTPEGIRKEKEVAPGQMQGTGI